MSHPIRPLPKGALPCPPEQFYAGRTFCVRDDKTIFGEQLPWKEAWTLKEQIAGRRVSFTVRMDLEEIPVVPTIAIPIVIEPGTPNFDGAKVDTSGMTPTADDGGLEAARAAALAAARGAAQQANDRQAEIEVTKAIDQAVANMKAELEKAEQNLGVDGQFDDGDFDAVVGADIDEGTGLPSELANLLDAVSDANELFEDEPSGGEAG